MGKLYQAVQMKNEIGELPMNREFYIEWLYLTGDYSKSFYERMSLEELEKTYLEMIDERSEKTI